MKGDFYISMMFHSIIFLLVGYIIGVNKDFSFIIFLCLISIVYWMSLVLIDKRRTSKQSRGGKK
jgi:hypothetical protein